MTVRVEEYLDDIGTIQMASSSLDGGDSIEICHWHSAARVSVLSGGGAIQELFIWGVEMPARMPVPSSLRIPGAILEIQIPPDQVTTHQPLLDGKQAVPASAVRFTSDR